MPPKRSPRQAAYLKRLGAHIKAIREERGYSQDRLYLEAGFSRANMWRIEAGLVDAQVSTLKRVSEVLGVPLARLFDFE